MSSQQGPAGLASTASAHPSASCTAGQLLVGRAAVAAQAVQYHTPAQTQPLDQLCAWRQPLSSPGMQPHMQSGAKHPRTS
jgi:hypothetical protein